MASIFTKIIEGEIPSYKIIEDELCYAFLDINPLSEGHALVVPKKEVDYIFDLDDVIYHHLLEVSKKISRAMDSVLDCDRIALSVVGLEVPHAHVHLIPIREIGDINFSKARVAMSDSKFQVVAKNITEALIRLYPDFA